MIDPVSVERKVFEVAEREGKSPFEIRRELLRTKDGPGATPEYYKDLMHLIDLLEKLYELDWQLAWEGRKGDLFLKEVRRAKGDLDEDFGGEEK